MADVIIDYHLLNKIAGSFKNLAVDMAAKTTWEDAIAEASGVMWEGNDTRFVTEAVNDMIGDWDYARSIMSLQAMQAAMQADTIGMWWSDWDSGVGTPGTSLSPGEWEDAGGAA